MRAEGVRAEGVQKVLSIDVGHHLRCIGTSHFTILR